MNITKSIPMVMQTEQFVHAFVIIFVSLYILSILVFVKTSVAVVPNMENPADEIKVLVQTNSTFTSCNCVAFRLDDVMDYYVTNPLIEVMNVFKEKNLDLTIGIIGDNFGNDKRLVSYIKDRVNDNNYYFKNNTNASIEIANHSWKHEDFSNLTVDQMFDSIYKTNQKIKNIFGIKPTVFIPPFNKFNNDIFVPLHKNNITRISASEINDPPPYEINVNSSIYRLPITAFTGDCNICGEGVKNASWFGIQHQVTLNQIHRSLSNYGFAVVMLHPWEYTVGHNKWMFNNKIDLNQISELRRLLNELKNEGLKIVTVSEIVGVQDK